jgi:hypothetical protein
MGKKKRLLDEYQFLGFRPRSEIQGIFGDSKARIIRLERTQKKQRADAAGRCIEAITTRRNDRYGICPVGMPESTYQWKFDECSANGVGK